jgi:putative flippase GtrA
LRPGGEKIRYLVVGVWNTVFSYLSFAVLYFLFSPRLHYLVLLAISNLMSITNAYAGYKIFVFRTRGNYIREYFRFYVVYGAAIAINFVLLPVCVELLKIPPLVAAALLTAFTVASSYLGHKHFSFRRPAG